jgi:hypothetical protein
MSWSSLLLGLFDIRARLTAVVLNSLSLETIQALHEMTSYILHLRGCNKQRNV